MRHPVPRAEPDAAPEALPEGGEMARLVRAHDWAATPLGPVEGWPASLRTALDIALASPDPCSVIWGPERVQLYNDAYRLVAADRHPAILGGRVRDNWAEAYETFLKPLLDGVTADGRPRAATNRRVALRRADGSGAAEERVFTFSFSAIPGEDGSVAGVFHRVTETTGAVLAEARGRFLVELGDALRPLTEPRAIMDAAAELVGRHLGVAAVGYGEVGADEDVVFVAGEHNDGRMPRVAGWQRLSERGAGIRDALRAGEALFVEDVEADPRWAAACAEAARARAAAAVPLVKDGRLVATLYAAHPEPRPWPEAEQWLLRDVAERTWAAVERGRAEAARAEGERRLRALVEGLPELVWRSHKGGEWTWASPQWAAYTGQSDEESRGHGWLDALHPDDRAAALAAWAAADGHRPFEAEYRVRHAASGRHRWCQTRATPVREGGAGGEGAGPVVEWVGVTTDVHELRALQERQGVMVAELQHRTRNLIAVVMAIAGQTLRRSESLEEFGERFEERLEALSRVQGLLSRGEDRSVLVETLLRLELDALGAERASDRVRLAGPEARLSGANVQTVALAIHELATNARKHGALAAEGGRLDVRWRVHEGAGAEPPRLALEWVESGVGLSPGRAAPARQGYGRHLIERALPRALGATTSFELTSDGARCTLELPLEPTREAEW